MTLFSGLVTGILFGVFLQQSRVIRFERQVGVMKLRDMTIVKFMLTAIVVGAAGIYLLSDLGIITFAARELSLGLQITGGLLFGIGWAVIGYCPGTSIAAFAEGRFHAIWPVLGMLIGGLIFVFIYPWVQLYIRPVGNFDEVSIPDILRVNHWAVIAVLAAATFLLFRFFEKKGL